jgi:hypothetical protein
MSHRFTPALLCTLILAAVPATAAAQTPPDERANARAFADVGLRLQADAGSVSENAFIDVPACRSDKRLNRATDRRQERAYDFVAAQILGKLGRAFVPIVDRANADLAAIPTADPALIGGRDAWIQIGQVYGTFAKVPHVRICIELRNYVRHGFKPTRAMRRATKAFRRVGRMDLERIDAKLVDASERLVELGIPKDEAAAFGGESSDDSGGGYEALPAPSSPLKLLRAAS